MKTRNMILTGLLAAGLAAGSQVALAFETTTRWNSITEAGWNCAKRSGGGSASIDVSTDTPDPSAALKMTYPAGFTQGQEPAMCWYMFPGQATEFWVEYHFKYSPNYYFHGVDNKQTYFFIGSGSSNFYLTVNGSRRINMVTQTYATDRHVSNTGYDPVIEPGRWYKIRARFVMNTPGVLDGVVQVWLDGKLVIDKNKIGYRSASQVGEGAREMQICPVFGGMSTAVKPAEDYQWYDYVTISTAPMSGVPTPPAPKPPVVDAVN